MTLQARRFLRFLLPSLFGVSVFLVPIPYNDGWSIGVGIAGDFLKGRYNYAVGVFITFVIGLSALMSVAARFRPPRSPFFNGLLVVGNFTLAMRLLGAVFVVMALLNVGPRVFNNPEVSGVLLNDLLKTLTTWFLLAGMAMPYLTDFGALDFTGMLFRKALKPLFTIPGDSAVNVAAAYIGSAPIGVVMTNRIFAQGYYTMREASVIAVTWCIISLPFNLFMAGFLKISFGLWYGTVTALTIINALILPRIWPLTSKPETYYPGVTERREERAQPGQSMFAWGLEKAMARADEVASFKQPLRDGARIVLDIYFGLEPLVMAYGGIFLMVATATPLFDWLATPVVPVLELLRIPEARAAAAAVIVGFADNFVPSILVRSLPELTRFIIGTLSVLQLIYMTEVGTAILKSDLDLNLKDLVILFLERTIISLPIIAAIGHYFY